MGEGAQSTGEGGSFAVRDVFFLQLRNLALIRVHSHSFAVEQLLLNHVLSSVHKNGRDMERPLRHRRLPPHQQRLRFGDGDGGFWGDCVHEHPLHLGGRKDGCKKCRYAYDNADGSDRSVSPVGQRAGDQHDREAWRPYRTESFILPV